MSLINKVEAIISNTSKPIDKVLPNKVNYDTKIYHYFRHKTR